MKKETYDYLADKMHLPPLPDLPKGVTVTQYNESKDILKQAQKIFGGEIIKQ